MSISDKLRRQLKYTKYTVRIANSNKIIGSITTKTKRFSFSNRGSRRPFPLLGPLDELLGKSGIGLDDQRPFIAIFIGERGPDIKNDVRFDGADLSRQGRFAGSQASPQKSAANGTIKGARCEIRCDAGCPLYGLQWRGVGGEIKFTYTLQNFHEKLEDVLPYH